MDKKTKGAWVIHHCNKLRSVTTTSGEYDQFDFAGKCGLLLSGLAASDEVTIDKGRVNAIAKAAGISTRLELPSILKELEKLGTEQNRKIYRNHGATGKFFGVSFGNLRKLGKKIGINHMLASELIETGNVDAQALAGGLSPGLLVGSVAWAAPLLVGASALFRVGLRRYASASS